MVVNEDFLRLARCIIETLNVVPNLRLPEWVKLLDIAVSLMFCRNSPKLEEKDIEMLQERMAPLAVVWNDMWQFVVTSLRNLSRAAIWPIVTRGQWERINKECLLVTTKPGDLKFHEKKRPDWKRVYDFAAIGVDGKGGAPPVDPDEDEDEQQQQCGLRTTVRVGGVKY